MSRRINIDASAQIAAMVLAAVFFAVWVSLWWGGILAAFSMLNAELWMLMAFVIFFLLLSPKLTGIICSVVGIWGSITVLNYRLWQALLIYIPSVLLLFNYMFFVIAVAFFEAGLNFANRKARKQS